MLFSSFIAVVDETSVSFVVFLALQRKELDVRLKQLKQALGKKSCGGGMRAFANTNKLCKDSKNRSKSETNSTDSNDNNSTTNEEDVAETTDKPKKEATSANDDADSKPNDATASADKAASDEVNNSAAPSASKVGGSVRRAKVLFAYDARGDTELTVPLDAIVDVINNDHPVTPTASARRSLTPI
jgi:hypothetical protein